MSEPVNAFAQRPRETRKTRLDGGVELIASFLDSGELNEFDIHVIPTFIGEGTPLVVAAPSGCAASLAVGQKVPRRPRPTAATRLRGSS